MSDNNETQKLFERLKETLQQARVIANKLQKTHNVYLDYYHGEFVQTYLPEKVHGKIVSTTQLR